MVPKYGFDAFQDVLLKIDEVFRVEWNSEASRP